MITKSKLGKECIWSTFPDHTLSLRQTKAVTCRQELKQKSWWTLLIGLFLTVCSTWFFYVPQTPTQGCTTYSGLALSASIISQEKCSTGLPTGQFDGINWGSLFAGMSRFVQSWKIQQAQCLNKTLNAQRNNRHVVHGEKNILS